MNDKINQDPNIISTYRVAGAAVPFKTTALLHSSIVQLLNINQENPDYRCHQVPRIVSETNERLFYEEGCLVQNRQMELFLLEKILVISLQEIHFLFLARKLSHHSGTNGFVVTDGFCSQGALINLTEVSKPLIFYKQQTGCYTVVNTHVFID